MNVEIDVNDVIKYAEETASKLNREIWILKATINKLEKEIEQSKSNNIPK